ITVALLILSVVLRQTPILLIALLLFLASGAARLWAKNALYKVEYGRKLSATRAFYGETVTLEIRLANRKILPLPWAQIQDEVPEGLTYPKGKISNSGKPERLTLTNFLTLGWYYSLTRKYPIECTRRGYYTFGPATIRSGDLFGFSQTESFEPKVDQLIVYPPIVPLEQLGIPSKAPFGDIRLRQHLFEDPARVMTIRDYVAGDPLKRVHWRSTARHQKLQTKVFEPTTSVDLALFLDVRSIEPPFYGIVRQRLETTIVAAASIADYAIRNDYRVGLYVNEPYHSAERMIKLPPSDHPDQLMQVLEALAQLQGWPLMTLAELIEREARLLPWNATIAIITSTPDEALLATAIRFRRTGRKLALITVGNKYFDVRIDGIPSYNVSDAVNWHDIEGVRIDETTRAGGR
ncbi:MAG: DUF58 domain-containing protein, partial [Dehalococcoidia bacterium]|nr:DUF58 domain-containing protein [Dehalococcoidia bacterium]